MLNEFKCIVTVDLWSNLTGMSFIEEILMSDRMKDTSSFEEIELLKFVLMLEMLYKYKTISKVAFVSQS